MNTLINNRGVITVFIAIIFAAVLLVAGVLIDAARIILAQKLVKGALDSAVRSAFACCHEGLIGEFGLFACELKESDLSRYYRVNLNASKGALNFLTFSGLSLEIKTSPQDSLLNNENLESQIRQYMQYKAPLLIGENLIHRLNSYGLSEKTTMLEKGQQLLARRKKLREECSAVNQLLADLKGATAPSGRLAKTTAEEIAAAVANKIAGLLNRLDNGLMPAFSAYEEAAGEYPGEEGSPPAILQEDAVAVAVWAETWREEMENTRRDLQMISRLPSGERPTAVAEELAQFRSLLLKIQEINLDEYGAPPAIPAGEMGHKKVLAYLNHVLDVKVLADSDLLRDSAFLEANKLPGHGKEGAFVTGLDEKYYRTLSEEMLEKEVGKVIGFLSLSKQKLGELLGQGQDSLYRMEYVMDKFTFLTSSTRRDHFLEKGEIEFILGGSKSELDNLLLVFQEIWAYRFAVNTLSSFLKSALPEPMARMASALAQGFAQACRDIVRIYNGEAVAFFPDVPSLQLRYSDYLRLFLLLQDKEEQLNRMRQLVQVNMRKMQKDGDFNLGNLRTKAVVTAQADINLWFLSAQVFRKNGISLFPDGKYRIVQNALVAY